MGALSGPFERAMAGVSFRPGARTVVNRCVDMHNRAMYGKHFASMYSGSMFGKPALVFAIMGYVIANQRPSRKTGQCFVELNPTVLAATFSATVSEVRDALNILESPDPNSRTRAADGRRLVLLDSIRHDGPMQFQVVNGTKYRELTTEEDRRSYLREAQRQGRQKAIEQAGKDERVLEVFEHWRTVMGKSEAVRLTAERARKILARLKEYSVEEIKQAITNSSHDAWTMGRDEKSTKAYNDIVTILRDDTQLEKFRDMGTNGGREASPEELAAMMLEG